MKLLNLFTSKSQENAVISGGRSMVEMLGVLAIIGVLSVGAIAGYQKAMLKYRLNKQAEQLNPILAGILQYQHEWEKTQGVVSLKDYFLKLGIVSEEMNTKNSGHALYDIFGNALTINTNGTKADGTMQSIGFSYTIDTSTSFEICQNLHQIAKSYSEDIARIGVFKQQDSSSSSGDTSLHGNKFCKNTRLRCLSTATMNDIHDACIFCKNAQSCYIWMSISIIDGTL